MKALIISFLLGFCALATSKTLNLEELASAITEHNKKGASRIVSLEDLNKLYSFIEGAVSADQYMRRYRLSKRELTRRIFGSVYHLPLEGLSTAVVKWNKQQKDPGNIADRINSVAKYDSLCDHIHGALPFKVYQVLYGITRKEFIETVFVNEEYFLSLDQVPQAVGDYNKRTSIKKNITSFTSYTLRHPHIEGALSYGAYSTLTSIDNPEFIKLVFSGIHHLTLDEIPEAIRQYHNKVKASKIISLVSYRRYRTNIKGALSFEVYQILYGITEEEFEDILKSAEFGKSFTAEEIEEYQREQQKESEHHTQSDDTNNENAPLLTLEETPQAIMEYNKPDAQNRYISHPINSWDSYEKHHDRIPGADNIRNLEKQFYEEKGTRYGFIEFLLGQARRTLTPIELSRAIEKHNNEASLLEQIDSLEEYEIFSYRIPHAPTLEAFRESVRAQWNELFQRKFKTVENYIEFIILGDSCQESLAN